MLRGLTWATTPAWRVVNSSLAELQTGQIIETGRLTIRSLSIATISIFLLVSIGFIIRPGFSTLWSFHREGFY